MSMCVRTLGTEETYPLRLLVLRPGGTLQDCVWAEDQVPGGFHLGTEREGEVISIGSFLPQAHPALQARAPYRLRGMATHPAQQGSGAGSALIGHALTELHGLGADLLWCNARINAVPFYERLGFVRVGPPFEIAGIGTHYLMQRKVP